MRPVAAWLVAHGTETERAAEHPHGTALVFLTAAGVLLAATVVNWLRVRHQRSVARTKVRRKSQLRELDKGASRQAIVHSVACIVAIGVAAYGWYLFNEDEGLARIPEATVQTPDPDERFPVTFVSTEPTGAFVVEVGNRTSKAATVQCEIRPLGPDGEPVSEGTFTRFGPSGEETPTDVYTTILQVPPERPARLDVSHEVSQPPVRWEGSCEQLSVTPE